MSHSGEDKARTLAVEMAAIARASHVEDIAILDLRGASPITDYFLIGTGTSDRQIRAVAEELADHGKQVGQKAWRVAGRETATGSPWTSSTSSSTCSAAKNANTTTWN